MVCESPTAVIACGAPEAWECCWWHRHRHRQRRRCIPPRCVLLPAAAACRCGWDSHPLRCAVQAHRCPAWQHLLASGTEMLGSARSTAALGRWLALPPPPFSRRCHASGPVCSPLPAVGQRANFLHKQSFIAAFKQVFDLDTDIDVVKHHGRWGHHSGKRKPSASPAQSLTVPKPPKACSQPKLGATAWPSAAQRCPAEELSSRVAHCLLY